MEKRVCAYENCGKQFKPNHGKQKFCSDRCKVAASRANKTAKKKKVIVKSVTISSTRESPVISVPPEVGKAMLQSPVCKKSPDPVSEPSKVSQYCLAAGITEDDLISFHKKNKVRLADGKSESSGGSPKYNRFAIKNKTSG